MHNLLTQNTAQSVKTRQSWKKKQTVSTQSAKNEIDLKTDFQFYKNCTILKHHSQDQMCFQGESLYLFICSGPVCFFCNYITQ